MQSKQLLNKELLRLLFKQMILVSRYKLKNKFYFNAAITFKYNSYTFLFYIS
jgi:hypothetical protein